MSKLEQELREQFEISYKDRLKKMQQMYEVRYQSLQDTVKAVYDKIKQDELLGTMLQDKSTSSHAEERIKQIFGEVVAEERELIFQKLGAQIANLKFENEQLSKQNSKLKQSHEYLQKNFNTERHSYEQTKTSVGDELRKCKQEIYQLKIEDKSKQNQINEYRHKLDRFQQENEEMKELLETMKDSKIDIYNHEVQGVRQKIQNLQQENSQLNMQIKQLKEKFEKKYNLKKQQYKQKIEEYKNVINQYRNEKMTTKREQEDNPSAIHERKMMNILKQNEKKISEMRYIKDKEKIEIEKKYENRIKEQQTYYEKLLEQKIIEIQQNTDIYMEKMKEEENHLKKYIEEYEKNYMPISEYEQEMGKRDELIVLMKRKMDDFEVMNQTLIKKEEQNSIKLKDYQILVGQMKQKISQLEEVRNQALSKLKAYEQSNNILKLNEQKSKVQFQEYQKIIKKGREEIEDMKINFHRSEEARSIAENTIRQKQRAIKDLVEEVEQLNKKLKKTQQKLSSVTSEKEGLGTVVSDLRKQISTLEYKIKDLQHLHQLNLATLQNKYRNAQQEIKEKSALLSESLEKYQQLNSNYQEQKRKCLQLDNIKKKYQVENQFYKSSGEMHKNDHLNAIDELRRNIQEKNNRIQAMQNDYETKIRKLKISEMENGKQLQKSANQNKQLLKNIGKLSKIITSKLQHLRKDCRNVKDYLATQQVILQNEQVVTDSILTKHMVQLQLRIETQQQLSTKKCREVLNLQLNHQLKSIKSEFEDKSRVAIQKFEVQKSNLNRQIKQKQNLIDDLNKQLKKANLQTKTERQSKKQIQKMHQLLQTRFQKQKQSYEAKLSDTLTQFTREKESIIKEYCDKKDQMQQEIQSLIRNLKKIKSETEQLQANHEQQKIQIQAQLRTVKDQEQAIHKAVRQKQQEAVKIEQDKVILQQSKKVIENQVKSMSQLISKKTERIHELQLSQNQLMAENNLLKSKCDRLAEEGSQIRRQMRDQDQKLQENEQHRVKIEQELRDIKSAIGRSNKNQQLRALSHLSMETAELSNKVNQMKKMSILLDQKTPLRY